MKNLSKLPLFILLLFAIAPVTRAANVEATDTMYVLKTDGDILKCCTDDVERIMFEAPYVAVDLGLSVKWADRNVGASSPEDLNGKYCWGETENKNYEDQALDNYAYYVNGAYQDIGKDISGTQYDVAHVLWGGAWRMPTITEFEELCKKCSWRWTTRNGSYGYVVTGPNGNTIFLPACFLEDGPRTPRASYWSSTQVDNDLSKARCLYFDSGGYYTQGFYHDLARWAVRSVRPVCK